MAVKVLLEECRINKYIYIYFFYIYIYRPGMCFLKHSKFKEIVLVPRVSKNLFEF